MTDRLFKAAWGSVELWLADIETDQSRDLVVTKYIRGNVADVQNKGNVPAVARCTLIFDEIKGQAESGQERLDSLIALKDQGKPQLFTHPIHGTYLAEIGEFSHRLDSSGVLSGTATFTPTEDVGAVTVDPIGITLSGDTATIEARADDVDSAFADVDLTTDVTDVARSAAVVFDEGASTRDTLIALGSMSERIGQEINDQETEADIALWPAMKALVMLADAGLAATNAVAGDQGGIMTIRVDRPQSLRRLCADLYGGGDAAAGYDQALSLNDIATPARIPSGTVLHMPQPGTF